MGQRMIRSLFGGGCHAKKIIFAVAFDRADRLQNRASDGQGSGLVEHDGIEIGEALQGLSAFEEHANLSATTDCHSKRGGNGKTHRAGARDNENRDRAGESQRSGIA